MIKLLMKLWLRWKYSHIRGDPEKSRELAEKIIMQKEVTSPEKVAFFLAARMKYVSDPLWGFVDIQQDLDYTFNWGWKGDCDDYAAVAYRLLEQLNKKPYMLTILRKTIRRNHVVCVFKNSGKWGLIGTEGFEEYESFQKLIEKKGAIAYSQDRLS